MIRVVFGGENTVNNVERGIREKTLSYGLWLLNMSHWGYQIEFHNPGKGTGRQFGTDFISLIEAKEGLWLYKERLEQEEKTIMEPWRE